MRTSGGPPVGSDWGLLESRRGTRRPHSPSNIKNGLPDRPPGGQILMLFGVSRMRPTHHPMSNNTMPNAPRNCDFGGAAWCTKPPAEGARTDAGGQILVVFGVPHTTRPRHQMFADIVPNTPRICDFGGTAGRTKPSTERSKTQDSSRGWRSAHAVDA